MNNQDLSILQVATKQVSFKNCKECEHFKLINSKSTCDFQGETLEDCRLTQIDIKLL